MLASFLRRVLVSLAAVVLLASVCLLSSASAQRESAATLQDAKPTPASNPSTENQTPKTEPKPNEEAEKKGDTEKKVDKSKLAKEKLPPKKQLRAISLGGAYDDLTQPPALNPTALLLGSGNMKSKSFYRLCEYAQEIAEDANVPYVLFDLSDPAIGMNSAQLDELTRRLSILKSKGKKLYAWLETAANVHLAIAVCCDEIIMADFGGIDMPSAAMETMFYRDAMDLVGVKASVVRAGDFKGAVEPYTNHVMSDHLKSHYVSMLESINAAQVSRIAKGRGLTNASVRELQKKRMLLPAEALAAGLVTKLAPFGSMKKTIQEAVGSEIEWTTPKSKPKREMSFFEFMSKAMAGPRDATRLKDDTIAVLHLSGTIVDGKEASPGDIVAGPMVKTIQELAQEERIKGVVVRVNSPGGSATASEAIRQALLELAKKKPMVFSMGDVAASGGYWVTCIGQPIYAERGTITGSIGVFSLKLSLGSMLRRVGVHVESVALDASAALDSMDRAWSEDDITKLQRFINEVYDRFLKIASSSRNIPIDKLQTLAGGRVWSGEQAKQHGLVDELGGLDDCISLIAKKAQIEKYKVLHRPDPPSGFDLFRMLDEPGDIDIATSETGLLRSMERQLVGLVAQRGFRLDTTRALFRSSLNANSGKPTVWALLPFELRIR
ncbi:MAG: signal peptide peptidase SppA [Pirellula sp.]